MGNEESTPGSAVNHVGGYQQTSSTSQYRDGPRSHSPLDYPSHTLLPGKSLIASLASVPPPSTLSMSAPSTVSSMRFNQTEEEPPDLSYLTPEERAQISMVMNRDKQMHEDSEHHGEPNLLNPDYNSPLINQTEMTVPVRRELSPREEQLAPASFVGYPCQLCALVSSSRYTCTGCQQVCCSNCGAYVTSKESPDKPSFICNICATNYFEKETVQLRDLTDDAELLTADQFDDSQHMSSHDVFAKSRSKSVEQKRSSTQYSYKSMCRSFDEAADMEKIDSPDLKPDYSAVKRMYLEPPPVKKNRPKRLVLHKQQTRGEEDDSPDEYEEVEQKNEELTEEAYDFFDGNEEDFSYQNHFDERKTTGQINYPEGQEEFVEDNFYPESASNTQTNIPIICGQQQNPRNFYSHIQNIPKNQRDNHSYLSPPLSPHIRSLGPGESPPVSPKRKSFSEYYGFSPPISPHHEAVYPCTYTEQSLDSLTNPSNDIFNSSQNSSSSSESLQSICSGQRPSTTSDNRWIVDPNLDVGSPQSSTLESNELGSQLTLDVAMFAATIATDTDSMINKVFASPEIIPKEDVSYTNKVDTQKTAKLRTLPQSGSVVVYHQMEQASSRVAIPVNLSEEVDTIPSNTSTPIKIEKRGRIRSAGSTDWAPAVDLSPIEDVSPSVEEAERLDMIERQTSSEVASFEDSEDPDDPKESLLKRCQNYDNISSLTDEQKRPKYTRSESIERCREDFSLCSTEANNADDREIVEYFSKQERQNRLRSGKTESTSPSDSLRRRLPHPKNTSSSLPSYSPNKNALNDLKEALKRRNESNDQERQREKNYREKMNAYQQKAKHLETEEDREHDFYLLNDYDEDSSKLNVVRCDLENGPVRDLRNCHSFERYEQQRNNKANIQEIGRSYSDEPKSTTVRKPLRDFEQSRIQEDLSILTGESGSSTPDSTKMSRRRLPQLPKEISHFVEGRPGNRRELEIVKARLRQKQLELKKSSTALYPLVKQRSHDGTYSNYPHSTSETATVNNNGSMSRYRFPSPDLHLSSSSPLHWHSSTPRSASALPPSGDFQSSIDSREGLVAQFPYSSLPDGEEKLATETSQRHTDEFEEIRNLEQQLDKIRLMEQHQMSEIQAKMAGITGSGRCFPIDSSNPTRVPREFHDSLSLSCQSALPSHRRPMLNDSASSSAHSYSPRSQTNCVQLERVRQSELSGASYDRCSPSIRYSSPLEGGSTSLAKAPQSTLSGGQFDPSVHNLEGDAFLDSELFEKEQRIVELEREIDMRKHQIEETIRLQEDLRRCDLDPAMANSSIYTPAGYDSSLALLSQNPYAQGAYSIPQNRIDPYQYRQQMVQPQLYSTTNPQMVPSQLSMLYQVDPLQKDTLYSYEIPSSAYVTQQPRLVPGYSPQKQATAALYPVQSSRSILSQPASTEQILLQQQQQLQQLQQQQLLLQHQHHQQQQQSRYLSENYSSSEYLTHRNRVPEDLYVPYGGGLIPLSSLNNDMHQLDPYGTTLTHMPSQKQPTYQVHQQVPQFVQPQQPAYNHTELAYTKSQDSGVSMSDAMLPLSGHFPGSQHHLAAQQYLIDSALSPIPTGENDYHLRGHHGLLEPDPKVIEEYNREQQNLEYSRRPISGEYDNYHRSQQELAYKNHMVDEDFEEDLLMEQEPLSSRYDKAEEEEEFDEEWNDHPSHIQQSSIWTDVKQSRQQKPRVDSSGGYNFPTKRLLFMRDPKEKSMKGNGIGLRIVGGEICPSGQISAFVTQVIPGGAADRLNGEVKEHDEIVEWNGVCLMSKSFEEVQRILKADSDEVEILLRTGSDNIPRESNHQREREREDRRAARSMASSYDNLHQRERKDLDGADFYYDQAANGQRRPSNEHDNHRTPQRRNHQSIKRQRATDFPDYPASQQEPPRNSSPAVPAVVQVQDRSRSSRVVAAVSPPPPPSPQPRRIPENSTAGSSHQQEQIVPTVVKPVETPAPAPALLDKPTSSNRKASNAAATEPAESSTKKEDKGPSEIGEVQVILTFDDYDQSLTIHIARAKDLQPMDLNGLADPFCKIRLHPDPTEESIRWNLRRAYTHGIKSKNKFTNMKTSGTENTESIRHSPDFNRQTRYMSNTLTPEWQQTVVFMNVLKRTLRKRILEITVWDFDRLKTNDFMGQTLIPLADKSLLNNKAHWFVLHNMKEVTLPGSKASTGAGSGGKSSNSKGSGYAKTDGKSGGKNKGSSAARDNAGGGPLPPTTGSNTSPPAVNLPLQSSFSGVPVSSPLGIERPGANVGAHGFGPGVPQIRVTDSSDGDQMKLKMQRSLSSGSSPDRIRNLTRGDTTDSKSSNSSSVTTDFLSEEQRETVRRWLGPGQLLLISYSQRADKIGNLPDENLVIGEIYMVLRKIADEETLIVTAKNFKDLKAKGVSEVYIKFYLMYGEQQLLKLMKRKTKRIWYQEGGTDTVAFNETFVFNTSLEGMLLQASLWSGGKGLSSHRMLGEAVIHLDDIESVTKTSKKAVNGWYKLLKPEI